MTKKGYIFLLISLIVVFCSFAPTLYELKKSSEVPSSRSFELIHNYITDYNFYLSRVREGWDGQWTATERYTSEPHAGSLLQELYVVIGHIVRPIQQVDLAVPLGYHGARFIFSIFLVFGIAWAVQLLFHSFFWSLLAFLLVVTASGWPIFVAVGDTWRIGGYMAWWTALDSLQRLSFLPHILLGQALILYLVVKGGVWEYVQKAQYLVLGASAFLLGIVFPPGLVFVFVVYGMTACFELVFPPFKTKYPIKQWIASSVLPRLSIACIALPTLLYYGTLLSHYPWKRLVEFDSIHPTAFYFLEYVKTQGPLLFLGLIGSGCVIWKKDRTWYPIVGWTIADLLLIFGFTLVPIQHPLRFTEMAVFVPLGLLSAYACHFFITKTKTHRSPLIGIGLLAIPFCSIALGFVTMYSSWIWQKDFVDQKVRAGWPHVSMNNYIVYPTKGFIDAVSYINTALSPSSIILSLGVAGNYIPARTSTTVYVGHDNTVHKEEKLEKTTQFFQGTMSAKEAYAFLYQNHITAVFFGPEEKEANKGKDVSLLYPFLRSIFTNSEVTIYQVQ